MAGTATLAALAAPPWFFLAPQVAYHVAHLGYIAYVSCTGNDATWWERYELSYASWINGGATVFLVFGAVGGKYTRMIIEGQQRLAVAVADPRAELDEVDADNFRKQFLNVNGIEEMEEVRMKNEKKATVMGEEQEWERGLKTKRVATLVMGVCMAPALVTHVIPGFVGYFWVVGVPCVLLHLVCTKWLVPRNRYLSLVTRIVLLDLILALYAVCLQDSFNLSLAFYHSPTFRYLAIVPTTFSHHSTSCFFCRVLDDFDTLLSAVSFA